MARGGSILAVLLFAMLAASAGCVSAVDASSALAAADSGDHGRQLQAAKKPTKKKPAKKRPTKKPKPTKKKPTVKVLTGKACKSFGTGCSTCTKTACRTCGATYTKSGSKCVCKSGYVKVSSTGACVAKPKPAKGKPVKAKPTKKVTKKPTKAPTKTPTAPASQPVVADPSLKAPKVLTAACKGPVAGSLKFTILPGLHPFSGAAAACTAAGLRLPEIDDIYAGSNGAAVSADALSTVSKCVGVQQAVWFDTSLAAPRCNAFSAVGSPADGGVISGRKLSALPNVLLTMEVPTGCTTKLPVMCI